VPKKEGGLRIKRLVVWNIVSMLNRTWNLFSWAGSLWVAWIHHNRLKWRSFWEVFIPYNCQWNWKKLLNLWNVANSSSNSRFEMIVAYSYGMTFGIQRVA